MDKIYYTLLATLVALQSQFRSFIEDRPGLITDTNELEKPWTGLAYNKLMMDLNQLTDIEDQSVELEENLRRTMIEISSSQGRTSPQWTAILNLQRRLEGLQANVRAAIRILSGRSIGNYSRRTLFRTMLENKKKHQVKTGFPPRVRSLPNIPSILIDQDFGSDFLKTSKSENRSIFFKEGQPKDQFQILESILSDLESRRKNTVRNLDETSSLPGLNIHLHRPQQHQFEEGIEVEPYEDIVLEIPIQVESSPQQQLFEEDSEDDLYSDRVSEVPVPVMSSPQQPLEEDSEDDLYSNRVSEVPVPVQSSPWSHQFEEDMVDELSEEMDSDSPIEVQSSSQQQFDEDIDDELYGYRFPVPVLSSPPQPLEEDSEDDLYSNRVSEVPVPVQSSPWVRIWGVFQRIRQSMNDFGRLLSRNGT